MTKGTTSMGKFTRKKTHVRCKRCGRNSLHKRAKRCASCGYPDPRIRKYGWIKRYTR
ncbi:MAG: 50S ribosomal protein L37e [Thermoproteota archaeon]|nr:50S ribosomal protein L37e [Thermoproteota archaeon]